MCKCHFDVISWISHGFMFRFATKMPIPISRQSDSKFTISFIVCGFIVSGRMKFRQIIVFVTEYLIVLFTNNKLKNLLLDEFIGVQGCNTTLYSFLRPSHLAMLMESRANIYERPHLRTSE